MDNLKSKVVSLELAKRMKELGWIQRKSYFIWLHNMKDTYKYGWKIVDRDFECHQENDEWYDAPLFCEVWDELPDIIEDKNRRTYRLTIQKYHDKIDIEYSNTHCSTPEAGTKCPADCYCSLFPDGSKFEFNPTESAGELWCWGRENGYIKEE